MPRPRKNLPRNGTEIIRELASRGVKETDIAKALGMSFDTWRRIRDNNPEARAVYEEAKAVELDKLVGRLYAVAMDPKDPKSSSAAMFLLKARHGYRDYGPAEGESGPLVHITLPAAMSPQDYEKVVHNGSAALLEGESQ